MAASYPKRFAWLVVLLLCWPSLAGAQYFGRNKVQYRPFDFRILSTDHFDLYYYPEEAEAAAIVARMAERWHSRLSGFFRHQLRGRQPLILYAVSAHFRQTNAIEGLIGEGTGGVTEALRRRIVLPMSGSLADTDHVIGHELVHAFQFDLTGEDPREAAGQMPGILAFPLWFVEGMAEYLSLGPIDAQTAMWLRDAVEHDQLPRIADLDDQKYFPYRWGHAFWAYIGARYGDRTVASLIRSAANPRVDLLGLAWQLGTDPDTLTADWHAAIRATARTAAADRPGDASPARMIIGRPGGGRYNLGPRISPDGRFVAFFSERDRFSVELFLADAQTGRVVRRLIRTATDPHFDSLEFLSSAGAWSPDGSTLAITAIRGGRPVLVLLDPMNGRTRREVTLAGLDDALNPAFAPDGEAVVLSGNVGGLIDLYRLSLSTGRIDRLTHDPYADLEPTFTPDGQAIVFVTERFTTDLELLAPGATRLAVLELSSGAVRPLVAFARGRQISPQVSADGASVMFIADPDGVSNLYRMPLAGGDVERLSARSTGIAGITASSPAMSTAAQTGRVVFSVFEKGGHAIYVQDASTLAGLALPAAAAQSALLPGRQTPAGAVGDVQKFLSQYGGGLPALTAGQVGEPYRRRFRLDGMGQPTVSAGIGQSGGFLAGGLSASFSDMLGDRGLGVSADVAGDVRDVGAQLFYLNRSHRWNWAVAMDVSPYRLAYLTRSSGPDTGETIFREVIERQPSRGVFGVTAYPFNTATRLEARAGAQSLSYTRDIRTVVFDNGTADVISLSEERTRLGPTLYLGQSSVAIVHDTSFFGATSPVYGTRYRLEVGRTVGSRTFSTWLLDGRRYFLPKRPLTVAVRGLHYGRYGRDAEDPQIINLYLGAPELVRGYGMGSFSAVECLDGALGPDCDVFRSLLGSRLLATSVELRAPLAGLFSGEFDYGRVPVEIAAFADAGLTWTSGQPLLEAGRRSVVRSAGGAVRVNLFGWMAVELSVARALDRPSGRLQWQLGVKQGF